MFAEDPLVLIQLLVSAPGEPSVAQGWFRCLVFRIANSLFGK
jgi:hypothetical protein